MKNIWKRVEKLLLSNMEKKKINVEVSWTGDNYCCAWEDGQDGVVLVAAKTIQKLKEDFEESMRLHILGCIEDGDSFPEYLASGDYEIEYNLDAAALIRNAETFTTMSVISRISGINRKQLSHYANGVKHPRPAQIARIKAALAIIGTHLLALS